MFGLAPARVVIFDTISEFKEASGTWGFVVGGAVAFGAGGGLGGDMFGFAAVAVGSGRGVVVCGVGAGSESRCFGDGLEDSAASSDLRMVSWESSRTLLRILEVSGVTGVFGGCFAGAGGGVCDSGFFAGGDGAFEVVAFCGGRELAAGLDAEAFAGVAVFALGVLDFEAAALVDFARIVDFLVVSGISDSTGSEMTFLGLPLFLAISEDISYCNFATGMSWTERGNFEDV